MDIYYNDDLIWRRQIFRQPHIVGLFLPFFLEFRTTTHGGLKPALPRSIAEPFFFPPSSSHKIMEVRVKPELLKSPKH